MLFVQHHSSFGRLVGLGLEFFKFPIAHRGTYALIGATAVVILKNIYLHVHKHMPPFVQTDADVKRSTDCSYMTSFACIDAMSVVTAGRRDTHDDFADSHLD